MSPSSFLYNCNNVSHVIKKIFEIIDFNESRCDIYTMDYISQSPTHGSKGNHKCVLQCTKFPQRQVNGYMFQTNFLSIIHLVHSSVQVPTWWWSKYSFDLIGTKVICIGFIYSGALMGKYQ